MHDCPVIFKILTIVYFGSNGKLFKSSWNIPIILMIIANATGSSFITPTDFTASLSVSLFPCEINFFSHTIIGDA